MAVYFPACSLVRATSPHGQIATYDPNAVIPDAFEPCVDGRVCER
jgi:hypothetical protein